MITEEMLRAAAVRSSEIYVAHLEKGMNRHEFSPEFEKSIQDIVIGGKDLIMIDEDMIRRSDVLKWLDGRIKAIEDIGCTTSIALNAELATLRDVRDAVAEMPAIAAEAGR